MKGKRTALVLGGGGARGAYQIGVWQALRELGIEIDFVCGTSVGAINSAIIAQDEFDIAVALWKELNSEMIFDIAPDKTHKMPDIDFGGLSLEEATAYAKEIIGHGGADASRLKAMLEAHIDERAIRSSKTGFGLTTVELPFFKLHRLTVQEIPNGRLVDYLMASAAVTPAIKPYEIDGVLYIDGAYGDVMPVRMALDRKAAHIVAVDLQSLGVMHKEDIDAANQAGKLTLIAPAHSLGHIMSFEPENTSRIMRLGYLDAMKAFGVFEGHYCTFVKGAFTEEILVHADTAGKIFELDPGIIYRADIFNYSLADKIIDTIKEVRNTAPFDLFDGPPDILARLGKKINRKTITVHIAEQLKKGRYNTSLFNKKQTFKLLQEEIAAAEYIVRTPFFDLLFETSQ